MNSKPFRVFSLGAKQPPRQPAKSLTWKWRFERIWWDDGEAIAFELPNRNEQDECFHDTRESATARIEEYIEEVIGLAANDAENSNPEETITTHYRIVNRDGDIELGTCRRRLGDCMIKFRVPRALTEIRAELDAHS